jgi:Rrf2 family protein
MLRLTRRSEYGIIAMTYLAKTRALARTEDDAAVSARDIAERYRIPKRLLAEVMKDLVHKGLVRSVRGASGGYRISAPADKTTVLHVLQALEGPFEMVPCASDGVDESLCELLSFCPIKGPIHRIHEKINDFLATVTLADLAKGEVGDAVQVSPAEDAPRAAGGIA